MFMKKKIQNLGKIALLLILTFSFSQINLFAQSPQSFQYQCIVRDAGGVAEVNQAVGFRISIISGSTSGPVEYVETHNTTTNDFGVATLAIGAGTPVSGIFADIVWGSTFHYLKVEADPTGSGFIDMGTTQLLSVPYALYAQTSGSTLDTMWLKNGNNIYNNNIGNVGVGISNPSGRMVIQGSLTAPDTLPLFEVKDKDGNSVFVVYKDSIHCYINDDHLSSNKGGFAVSGRSNSKSSTSDYLLVSPDSVRVYIEDNDMITSNRGGFAVSGRSNSKGNDKYYLNVSVDTTEIINPAQNRILWYPTKSAFLTGKVLIESPDSVGTNSFATGHEAKAVGDWSQSMGYNTIARGNYSTCIGRNSVAHGENSFAFGNGALSNAIESFAFGSGAIASGIGSYALGSQGVDTATGLPNSVYTRASGMYSFVFGQGSSATNKGALCFGLSDYATGEYSLAMGTYSGAVGNYSSAIGLGCQSIGVNSFSCGIGNTTNGSLSSAFGEYSIADGYGSTAVGYMSHATGSLTYAFGYNCLAGSFNSFAAGFGSSATGAVSVSIGNQSLSSADMAMSFGQYAKASGISAMSLGTSCEAIGDNSTAIGYNSKSSGDYSTSIGLMSFSKGPYSVAIGNRDTTIGYSSFSFGSHNLSIGSYSTSIGYKTIAKGENSFSAGYYTMAKPYGSFVIGQFNDTTCITPYLWSTLDPIFIVGNGVSDNARSNAMMVQQNGEVYFPFVYDVTVGATNRDLYIDDAGKIGYLSSSKKYKKDITNMEDVSWLYNLRPVNYIYKKDETGKKQYGLIAEEVEKINPLFISYNKDGTVETVNYSNLITPLLKAIQSQQAEILALKNKVAEFDNLKTEIEKLKKYQSNNQ
jgi:hypothetical protein